MIKTKNYFLSTSQSIRIAKHFLGRLVQTNEISLQNKMKIFSRNQFNYQFKFFARLTFLTLRKLVKFYEKNKKNVKFSTANTILFSKRNQTNHEN